MGAMNLRESLELIVEIASEKGKIAALTETGDEKIRDPEWFTNRILNPILTSPETQNIAYIMMWRNHSKSHHYMPYPGHPSTKDFKAFIRHPFTLTLKDIGNRNQFE